MQGSRGLWLAVPCLVALAAVGAGTQQPSFRATTELVVVDVSVVGKDGAPVRGLQEADFSVTVDGKPRRVRSVKFVEESGAAAPAPAAAGARRVSSNASESTGRLALIAVDEGSIAFGGLRAAAESVDRLLAGFGPADKIGLAALPGPRMLVEFTRERARIADAIKRIPAGAGAGSMPSMVTVTRGEAFALERADTLVSQEVVSRECGQPPRQGCPEEVVLEARRLVIDERNRTAEFVAGMRGLLQALAAVDAPKLVIVFSEGFVDPEAASQLAACGGQAAAARATIFAMRLDRTMFDISGRPNAPLSSLTSGDERQWSIASLDALAGAARGTALEIIGSADLPFARLAREVSGYYLVGVEGEARDRDGKLHPIQVEVSRPGVTLRARRELVGRPVVKDEKKLLGQALASPLTVADLPLRVTTFNMADPDPSKVRVLIVGEVDREPPGDPPAVVGVTFTDEQGKTIGDVAQKMTLPPVQSGALSLMIDIAVPPGEYTMRLAVVRGGRAGSIEHRLSARLARPAAGGATSGLRLGDLLVATPVVSDRMTSALHGRVAGDRVVSFVQVGLDAAEQKTVSFVFDVVKEEAGAALLSTVGTLGVPAKGRSPVAEALVDVRLLPPGDYGVRLNVLVSGTPVTSLFAPFTLERPPRSAAVPEAAPAAARGARGARAAAPPVDAARFARGDVLEPQVVAPFLEEVARLAPAASRPALEMARAGRIDEAIRALEPGKAGDPALPFLRGLSLFARGDLQPASIEFRAAIADAPELFVGAFYIGACYAAGGRDTQAIGAWQTSLVGLRRYPAVYRFLGDALIRTGQADRARQMLAEAAARWPDDEALRARVVQATVEAGRYQQAFEQADRYIAAQPGDSSVLFLAMRSAFQALLEGVDIPVTELHDRLTRYRDLYVAAGGLQQALVEEWVKFAQDKAGSSRGARAMPLANDGRAKAETEHREERARPAEPGEGADAAAPATTPNHGHSSRSKGAGGRLAGTSPASGFTQRLRRLGCSRGRSRVFYRCLSGVLPPRSRNTTDCRCRRAGLHWFQNMTVGLETVSTQRGNHIEVDHG